MSRIVLDDSIMSAAIKMADGNPGAITAITTMMKVDAQIDPDSAWGEMSTLIGLDVYKIYGSRIWLLYKDVCDRDPIKVSTLLRAVQLGILGEHNAYIDGLPRMTRPEPPDFDALLKQVRERLPRFARVRYVEDKPA